METTRRRPEAFRIRRLREEDRGAVERLLTRRWGAADVVSRGRLHHAALLPGYLVVDRNRIVGLVTFDLRGGRCEVVTLDSLRPNRGIGTRLLAAVERRARIERSREIWLVTTNDNLRAIGFYQKRGMFLRRIHPGALARSRRLKPSIPQVGMDGIPLRDEIEIFKPLPAGRTAR